jgi:oligopeptide transport system substrate-binding protein
MYAGAITEAFRSSWNGDYPDPHTFLSILESDNSQNLPRWKSDEYDSLMERASKQLDLDTRARYMEEAERLLLSKHAVVPLYFYVSKHLVSEDVVGWEDNILDYHYSQHFRLENRP